MTEQTPDGRSSGGKGEGGWAGRGEDTKTSNQPRTNITKKIIQLERRNKDNHSQTYETNHREKAKLKCYRFQKCMLSDSFNRASLQTQSGASD